MSDTRSTIAAVAETIERILASPEYVAAVGDDEERAWLLIEALCEELHPRGAVTFPSSSALHRIAGRLDRNERIRSEFDGRNYEALSRRHRLSARQIRRIVDRGNPARRQK